MFIELTDHLRCPADHDEAFLVLLPDQVEHRDVKRGRLGCPICGWETAFTDGVVDFGGGVPATTPTALTVDAIRTFLGLTGPGGFAAMIGGPASLSHELGEAVRGVSWVLVNPPPGTRAELPSSVVTAGRLPLKAASMRGIVVGKDYAGDATWIGDAIGSVLPGLRFVIEGPVMEAPDVEVLGETEGMWVGRRSPDR
ncbi:MAG TPA: hypothetical protein VJU15_00385 [Gemmatimonadales bacterium]|nr:hypothetical protein [Gemmatimonadales bacterium]